MDDEMQAIEIRDPELERRFQAFARLRLTPDTQAIARIRARVMREARLQHDAARIAAYVAPVVEARRRSTVRRLGMPLLAAAVWTAIAVGTMAAAQPGGGLYPARMWAERAALPSGAPARVDADLRHLDDRISEALAAASVGDRVALAAALEAYAVSAEDATTTSAADAALVTKVEDALARHQAVLTALVAGLTTKGNDVAAAAIQRNLQRAIDHNAAVIATLETRGGGGASNGGGNDAAGANGAATGNGGGGGNGGGSAGGGSSVGAANGGGQGASGPTAGSTSGTGGTEGGNGTTGGAAGAGQNTDGQAAGSANGSGNEGDESGPRPTDPPAAGTDAPAHSPRGNGG